MNTFEAISKRVSIREYLAKPVPKNMLEILVDAGRRAPSARGIEPWDFVVVTDRTMLERIAGIATTGAFIKDAACCLAVFCKETKYYLEDGSAATENILLAATDLGLGACWVAGDKKPYADEVGKMLETPAGLKLVSLISIGWPAGEAHQAKSRALREVIHWEKF